MQISDQPLTIRDKLLRLKSMKTKAEIPLAVRPEPLHPSPSLGDICSDLLVQKPKPVASSEILKRGEIITILQNTMVPPKEIMDKLRDTVDFYEKRGFEPVQGFGNRDFVLGLSRLSKVPSKVLFDDDPYLFELAKSTFIESGTDRGLALRTIQMYESKTHMPRMYDRSGRSVYLNDDGSIIGAGAKSQLRYKQSKIPLPGMKKEEPRSSPPREKLHDNPLLQMVKTEKGDLLFSDDETEESGLVLNNQWPGESKPLSKSPYATQNPCRSARVIKLKAEEEKEAAASEPRSTATPKVKSEQDESHRQTSTAQLQGSGIEVKLEPVAYVENEEYFRRTIPNPWTLDFINKLEEIIKELPSFADMIPRVEQILKRPITTDLWLRFLYFFPLDKAKKSEKVSGYIRKRFEQYTMESNVPYRHVMDKDVKTFVLEYRLSKKQSLFLQAPVADMRRDKGTLALRALGGQKRLIEVGSQFGENHSPLASILKREFKKLLNKRKLTYEDVYKDDQLFDQLLIEATIETHRPLRVPGKYHYDTAKGEPSAEQVDNFHKKELAKRFRNMHERGLTFPEDQQEFYMDWHRVHIYNRKGAKEKFRKWPCDNEFIHKEKRRITLLKLGIDKFNKMYNSFSKLWGWGENAVILCDLLSTTMFNFQLCKILSRLTDLNHDPFEPEREMDYFNKYMLRFYLYNTELTFRKKLVTEVKDEPISEVHWGKQSHPEIVDYILDTLDDERCRVDYLVVEDFVGWLNALVEMHQQCFVTPDFLRHFHIVGIYDDSVLVAIVNYLAMQLGFHFHDKHDCQRLSDTEDMVTSIYFRCLVGSQIQNGKLGLPYKHFDTKEERQAFIRAKYDRRMEYFMGPKVIKNEDLEAKTEFKYEDYDLPYIKEDPDEAYCPPQGTIVPKADPFLRKQENIGFSETRAKPALRRVRHRHSDDEELEYSHTQAHKPGSMPHYVFETDKEECQCYARYERADKKDPRSPFRLTEFNFLHTHRLEAAIAYPMIWKSLSFLEKKNK